MISLLHIDDDKNESFIIRHHISRIDKDIEITWVESTQCAREVLKTNSIDCILCDYQMPEENGLEFLKHFRDEDERTPFIFYTSQGDETIAAEAFRKGANDYYSKGGSFAVFERLVHSIRSNVESSRRIKDLAVIEQEFASIFELNLGLLIVARLNGEILKINPGWLESLGYSEKELLGKNLFELVHPDDLEKTKAEAKLLAKGKKTISFAHRCRAKDGSYRHIRWSAVPSLKSQIILANAFDITAETELIAKLKTVKDEYMNLVENAPGVFYQFTISSAGAFSIPFVSEKVESMIGITAKELKDDFANFADLVDEQDKTKFVQHIKSATAKCLEDDGNTPVNDLYYHEHVRINSAGDQKLLFATAAPKKQTDGSVLWEGFLQDVTDKSTINKNSQRKLKRSEIRYQTLVENINEGIGIVSKDEQFLFVNNTGAQIFDCTPEDLIGKDLKQFVNDDNWGKMILNTQKVVKDGNNHYELEISTARGNTKTIEIITTSMLLPGDNSPVIFGAFTDITSRKMHQRQLEKINQEMETFSYTVSHDLKTPLRHIKSFTGILSDNHSHQLDKSGADLLKKLARSADNAENIITQLLKLSRVHNTELELSTLNISDMALEIINNQLNDNHHPKIMSAVARNMMATGDRGLIYQALENIISNAIKYSVFNETPEITVEELESSSKSEQMFRVCDNGEGFDRKYAEHIFEPFTRLRTTNQYEGSGIGLATVKRIITRHGGRIWAESEKGSGTQIYFSLPVHATR